jgi:anti-sigma B factor antagonist
MDPLKLTITANPATGGNASVVKILGPMLLNNLFDFQPVVRAQSAPLIVLDLTEVPYMDSAALGTLVHVQVSCKHSNRRLALAGVNDRVLTLLKVTNVDKVFTIYPTIAEALASPEAGS